MTHSRHAMDAHSLHAYARLKPEALRAQIAGILSAGIPRTARELAKLTGADLVSTRSRLSDGCHPPAGEPALFRKAVRCEEDGSATKVWSFALAEINTAPADGRDAELVGNKVEPGQGFTGGQS